MIQLEAGRAARLLVLATRLAKPRALFNSDQPRDESGKWSSSDSLVEKAAERYPKLGLTERDVRNTTLSRDSVYRGATVDGLRVRTHIPNTSSVESSYNEDEYESLPGIRAVPLDDLGLSDYKSSDDNERVEKLAAQIQESGEISPLIVVQDKEGAYVLEGNHRARALRKAGKTHAPALVIVEYPQKARSLARGIEGPLHKTADKYSAKLSVAIRYAFASARSAMRRKLQFSDDITEATALAIVVLRQELKEILPTFLRKIYVEGGRVGAELLSSQLRSAAFNEDQPRDERGRWSSTGGTFGMPEEGDENYFYHTTPRENLDSIAAKGLIPGPDSENVSLATNLDTVKWWSENLGKKTEAVLRVRKSRVNTEQLYQDVVGAKRVAPGKLDVYHEGEWKKLRTAEWRFAKRDITPKLSFRFDAEDERAVSWADRHSAELITQISETSREDINNATAEFLETGDWKEYREEILAAVGDERRADLIARNEPMRAVHEGQRAAWEQAIEEGLLPENAVREWIVVGDDKVCPICEGLEGKTAAIGEEYEEGIEGPPAHVSCRCSEGITGVRTLGGPGSGNFGHAGRPGEVGGSAPDSAPEANSPEEAQRIIEEEQKKWLTPEEYERLPPGIRAWKTRTRKEKAEGKEPTPKKEEKPTPPPKKEEKPGVVATKERENRINERQQEIYDAARKSNKSIQWSEAHDQARKEDEEKYGPLPPNSLFKRDEAIDTRAAELRKEFIAENQKAHDEGRERVHKDPYEKAMLQAREEDVAKWGPWAYPEEVDAIRESDKNWSPAQKLAEHDAKEIATVSGKIQHEEIDTEHRTPKAAEVRLAADDVARSMNFDPALIAVRDRGNNPRTFQLNGKTLQEGGHYNPQTGRIEVNASFGIDRGLIVHEIQHAQWDYVNTQAKLEQGILQARWSREQAVDFQGTRYFLKNGKVLAKYREEFERQMPHTSVLARAGLGNKELGIKADIEGMKRDDGVSHYSKEYWTKAEKERGFDQRSHTTNYIGELAVNETLSEVARRTAGHIRGGDGSFGLADRFVKLGKDVQTLYNKDMERVRRHFIAKQKKP